MRDSVFVIFNIGKEFLCREKRTVEDAGLRGKAKILKISLEKFLEVSEPFFQKGSDEKN